MRFSLEKEVRTYVSMKLIPMKSFLTRISPSLGWGIGRSVLYCRTSLPPVFSMITPFMVLGIEEAMVREKIGVRMNCEETAAALRVDTEAKILRDAGLKDM